MLAHSLGYTAALAITFLGIWAIFWLAGKKALPAGIWPGRDVPIWVFALGGIALAAFEILNMKVSVHTDSWDFLNAYFPAGQAIAHNDMPALRDLIHKGTAGFVNIPVVAYLFAPFGFLPPKAAVAAFAVIGLGLTVASWFLLVKVARLERREQWLLAWLFLTNGPLIHAVMFGNLSYFLLGALAGGLLLLRDNRSGWAGAVLGLAAVIKPPLILFGLFFLFRRDLKGVAGFAAVGVITVLLSLGLFGWADNVNWFQTCIVKYSQGWLPTFNVQSIPGFILRLSADAKLTGSPAIYPEGGQKLIAQILTGLIFLTAAAACVRWPLQKRTQRALDEDWQRNLQYCLVICLSLVSSPLTWSHYYAWLLVPMAFFLKAQSSLPKPARYVGWLAIALITPMVGWPWILSNPALMGAYRILIMSHLLLGGLLWFGLVAWWTAASGGLLRESMPPIPPETDQAA